MTVTLAPLKTNWITALFWLIANILGFGFVGAMFHNFPLAFTFPPNVLRLGSFRLEAAIVGFFFGFIPALLIGFVQRLILNRSVPLPRLWIISTSLGMGLMHFLADGFENARDLSLAVILGGLAVGVFQWRLLRPLQPQATWVIFINTLGWYVGWLIGIAMLHNTGLYRPWDPNLTGTTHGILGLSVGVVYSLSTGLFWIWLLYNPTENKTQ